MAALVDNVYVNDESIRERLLAAGVELLEQEGMAGIGLRAITRRAGVSHGAPRRYFPTHTSLLAAIAETGIADLSARITPLLAAPDDPVAALTEVGVRYVDFAVERPEMFGLMFRHDLLEGSGANLRATTLPLFAALTRIVPNGQVNALAFFAGIHGIAALAANRTIAIFGADVDLRALVQRAVRAQFRDPGDS